MHVTDQQHALVAENFQAIHEHIHHPIGPQLNTSAFHQVSEPRRRLEAPDPIVLADW